MRLRLATAVLMQVALLIARPAFSQSSPPRNDLVIDFGSAAGLWTFVDGTFTKLLDASPDRVAVGNLTDWTAIDVDDIAMDLGTDGLWTFNDNTVWHFVGTNCDICSPPGQKLLAIADPLGSRTYPNLLIVESCCGVLGVDTVDQTPAVVLNRTNVRLFAVGDIDHSAAWKRLDPFLYAYSNNFVISMDDGVWINVADTRADLDTWINIHPQPAQALAIADFDVPVGDSSLGVGKEDIAISFTGGLGTWIYRDKLAWIPVHPGLSAVNMAAGDLDGVAPADLVLDFGPGYGIWIYRNLTWWQQLHPSTSRHIVLADLDRNGVTDIVVDFGPGAGIWVYENNTRWYRLTALSAEQIVAAHLQ